MREIVNKIQQEIIKRSNNFETQTKGTKDEYNIYREHIQYVYKYVCLLSKDKKVNHEVLELSALLHDIAMTDRTLNRAKHNEDGAVIAEQLLRESGYPEEKLQLVKKCILNHSSKRADYRTTEEERILVDADVLSHFDSIANLYSLAHNVMNLNDEDAIRFIQDKLTKDYNEINDNLKYLITDKYNKIMSITSIDELFKLMNWLKIQDLMKQVNEWIKEILQDNYVGVYFHGSLRLGSFNPNKSDLDFIIVVKEKMNSKTKELIWDKMLEKEKLFPKKGFEFSVVLEENCRNINYPIAYELHGSREWIDRYKKDKTLAINDDYKVDPDLASHFNVINFPNNNMDFGKPAKEVFAKVPREYIIDSNYQDILDCIKEITNNPTYCILNLCRFGALIKDDFTLSKYDGGKWALENMNSSYNDIIRLAMEDYMSDTNYTYDNLKLQEFAKEAIDYINSYLSISDKSL